MSVKHANPSVEKLPSASESLHDVNLTVPHRALQARHLMMIAIGGKAYECLYLLVGHLTKICKALSALEFSCLQAQVRIIQAADSLCLANDFSCRACWTRVSTSILCGRRSLCIFGGYHCVHINLLHVFFPDSRYLSGEMSSLYPVSGTFAVFAERFVSRALGFTLGTRLSFVNKAIEAYAQAGFIGSDGL